MEYNIIDKIKSSEELQAQLKNGVEERKETYREQLERLYNYDILPGYNLTKEEAIKISMQNRQAIDSFYFNNVARFSRMARAFVRRKNCGTVIYTVEDILNQIYVDCRYYDFTSEKRLTQCIYATFRMSNNGGILNSREYRKDKKASRFLYDEISARNHKMEDGASLIDFISAPDETSNPETILINREQEKGYNVEMIKQLLRALPRAQRKKFLDLLNL